MARHSEVKLYRWRIRDQYGKLYEPRWRMTEAEALAKDPAAAKIPGSEYEPSSLGKIEYGDRTPVKKGWE